MNRDDFIASYPTLYHMAEGGSWPSVLEHGLLSTQRLLDLFEVQAARRDALLLEIRPTKVRLEHPTRGVAVVRDQIPLRRGPLEGCLVDLSLQEWLGLLNRRVYLWPTFERLSRFMSARAYRDQLHDVLYLDTAALLARGEAGFFLSPINSGSTLYNPRPRGSFTFQSIANYPFDERRRLRGVRNAVAEVAVDDGIPRMSEVVTRVERRTLDTVDEVLWVGE